MDLTSSSGFAPTQYIFPILKHSDILQCMSELSIELSKAELAEPARHKDRIKRVFLQLIEICCGLTEEDFEKTSDRCKDKAASFDFPQIHEDFSDTRLFLELKKCMETCGIYDFGWKDLACPTPKRFRCQLSAAINMAKFREDQLKLYAELNEPRMEMLKALEEVNDENNQLNMQFESLHMESENKFQEMEDVQLECEELEIEIARINKLQTAKREESQELKKRHNDLKDQLATLSLALQEVQAEYDTLQSRIVSSPERRTRQLQDLHANLDYERREAKALDEKLQEIKTKIIHITQALKDVPEVTDTVEEAVEGSKKLAYVQEQRNTARRDKNVIINKTTSISEDMDEAKKSLHRIEEKMAHMRKQAKVKMDAAQQALKQATDRLLEVEKDHMDGMARIEAGELEVKAIEASMDQERQKTLAEIKEMIDDYRATEKIVLEQNANLMTAIGAI